MEAVRMGDFLKLKFITAHLDSVKNNATPIGGLLLEIEGGGWRGKTASQCSKYPPHPSILPSLPPPSQPVRWEQWAECVMGSRMLFVSAAQTDRLLQVYRFPPLINTEQCHITGVVVQGGIQVAPWAP